VKTKTQLDRVAWALCGCGYCTLGVIRRMIYNYLDCTDSEAGISARLREINSPKRGGKVVKRIRAGTRRTWEYKMVRMPK
jgi:hypothetical protein